MVRHDETVLDCLDTLKPNRSVPILPQERVRSTSPLIARRELHAERIQGSGKAGRSAAIAHPLHDDWVRRVDLRANARYEGHAS